MPTIHIPDLRAKLDLLKAARRTARDGTVRHPYPSDREIARAMPHAEGGGLVMDPGTFSKAADHEKLSLNYLPAFLRLFAIPGVPDILDSARTEDAHWIALAQEPIDAFRARVRLSDGDSYLGSPGALWDAFCARAPGLEVDGARRGHLALHAVDRPDPLRGGLMRTLPQGAPNPVRDEADPIFTCRAGDRVGFVFSLAGLLRPEPRGYHVFAFHDVRVDEGRYFVPLVPFPPTEGTIMPRIPTRDAILEVPENPHAGNCLVVPDNWGTLRTVVAVVTGKALEDEILEDSRTDFQIRYERLDLLAARLADAARWPAGSFAILRFQYRVLPRGPAADQTNPMR